MRVLSLLLVWVIPSIASAQLSISKTQSNVTCFNGNNGTAVALPSGGTGPYWYSWAPLGGTSSIASGLSAGSYTVTVGDAATSMATATYTLTQPPQLVAAPVSQTNVSCNGGSNGAAQISASGGVFSYTYDWTPGNPTGDGTQTVTGLLAQSYTATVTDANGCEATRTFNVTSPPALVASANTLINISCNGAGNGAASVNVEGGTPSYSYDWTPGNPSGDGTPFVAGLLAQSYTATVTDANGCQAAQIFSVTQPSVLAVTPLSQTNVACNGGNNGAAAISTSGGTPGYTYDWSPGTPFGDGTTSVLALSAASYTVTVTDANACEGTATFNVTQPSAIAVSPVSQTNVACHGGGNGAASASASGGAGSYTYNWTPGNPTGDGTANVTSLSAQNYTLTVTDANACEGTRTFNVTQPSAIAVSPVSQTNVACHGGGNGAASASASGGAGSYTYNWTPGNPTGDGTANVTSLSAQNYTLTVTDANACEGTRTFTVTQPTALVVAPAAQTNVACNGDSSGAASVTASGGASGYTYEWAPGAPSGDGTQTVSALLAASYTVTVTDANSCIGTSTFNVTQPPAMAFSLASQSNPVCGGPSTGSASVNPASGGAGGFIYDWAPGAPTGDGSTAVSELAPGTYTVTATDANACTKSLLVDIAAPPSLVLTPTMTDVLCSGQSNGTAQVGVSGGTGPYTFDWAPGAPSGDGSTAVSDLPAGTYTVTVADVSSCTSTATITVTEPSPLLANGSSQRASGGNACDGSAQVAPSGGVQPYEVAWAPQAVTGATLTGQCANTTATITDANGCHASFAADFTQPNVDLSISLSSETTAVIAGATASFHVVMTSTPDALGATATVALPSGFTVSAVTASNDVTCSALPLTTSVLVCTTTGVVTSAGSEILVEGRVAERFGHGTLSVSATASTPSNDTAASNNTAALAFDVTSPAKLVAQKSVEQTAPDALRYTIRVRNEGPAAAADFGDSDEVVDQLPVGLSLAVGSASTGTVTTAGGRAAWNGVLRANETVVITLDTVIDATVLKGTVLSNFASVTYDENGDGVPETTDMSAAAEMTVSRENPSGRGCGGCSGSGEYSLAWMLVVAFVLRRRVG